MAALVCGCGTLVPLQTMNRGEEGWKLQQGQGIWKGENAADELVIGFALATHPDGRAQLQVFKEILLLATVQIGSSHWVVDEPLRKRRVSGRVVDGEALRPPTREAWLQLVLGLSGSTIDGAWKLERNGTERVLFQNSATGERMELFFEL